MAPSLVPGCSCRGAGGPLSAPPTCSSLQAGAVSPPVCRCFSLVKPGSGLGHSCPGWLVPAGVHGR